MDESHRDGRLHVRVHVAVGLVCVPAVHLCVCGCVSVIPFLQVRLVFQPQFSALKYAHSWSTDSLHIIPTSIKADRELDTQTSDSPSHPYD